MNGAEDALRIRLLHKVARINGTLLSVSDIIKLVNDKLTPEQVRELFEKEPSLNKMLVLNGNYVLEKDESDEYIIKALMNRSRAQSYISYISPLIGRMKSSSLVIAIGGSVSYDSAAESDDIDLFCITKNNYLWIFMAKSLLLTRIYHILRRNAPFICISCTMERSFAHNLFKKSDDPLFARDALTAVVLHGKDLYNQLIKSNDWMERYFPSLYRSKVATSQFCIEVEDKSTLRKVLNSFLFHTVGKYILMKAYLFNRILAKQRRREAYFIVKAGVDHCIYESRRYMIMRQIYRAFLTDGEG